VRSLRLVPWLVLFLLASAFGWAAPREWWVVPALALAGFSISLVFVRMGLHRLK
jgi:hypothetical protein